MTWTGWTECGICKHRAEATADVEPDQTHPILPLLCAGCGNMTAVPDINTRSTVADEPPGEYA